MALRSGERLGPYEVAAPLGAGGMGEVYRARDPRLGRDVALKVLPGDVSDPQRLRRFEEEARAVAALNHPHILAVYDIGREDDTPYVIFELLEGQTLRERLRSGALSPRNVVEYGEQLCQGLAAAHGRGIVHRDLKPANIFLTRDGPLKILDFGLARLTRERTPGEGTAVTETRPDVVLGTLGYLSPEQAQGRKADARSDVFAVGAVLYEMLSGRRAFPGETTADVLAAVLKEDPPALQSLSGPIPPALDRIVRRCLEKEPDDRFQSAKDVAFALEALSGSATGPSDVLPARSPRARWPWWVAAGVVGLAFFGAGFLTERLLQRPKPPPEISQLTFGRGAVWDARFTPDGQTVVYSASWGGNPSALFSERLDSLEPSPLHIAPANVASVSVSAELAIVRPPAENVGRPAMGTLARVSLGSDVVRDVLHDVFWADWAPDGSLAVLRRVKGRLQIEWPPGTIVHSAPDIHVGRPGRVSPDGDTLAFFGSAHDLHLVDRSGRGALVTGQKQRAHALAWHPQTGEIWYTTFPLGPGVQLRAVDRSGHDRLVHSFGHAVFLHDISVDGRVLVNFAGPTVWGFALARPLGAHAEHDLTFHSRTFPKALSSDGQTVLLQRGFTVEKNLGGYYVRSTTGGPAVRVRGFFDGQDLDLAPDGTRVLFLENAPAPHLVAFPVGAGEPEEIPAGDVKPDNARWFPDGRTLLVAGRQRGGPRRIFVLDGGTPRPLSPEGPDLSGVNFSFVRVSPDGQWVAVHDGWRITLFPVPGGPPQQVVDYEGADELVGWTSDGRALILRWNPQACQAPARLFRLDLASGEKSWIQDLGPTDRVGLLVVGNPVVARGGEAYAYYSQPVLNNLFLVEGLE